ncbi:hypothetical protein PT974_12578 [Cladobotryum mycophilum]|uniref:Heterokaryon incompatibility domain-containing protein n=1 Tax=Cladobotryum mycophilum TaxID=491253 RepID=A0ABR0S8I3_9HYPO
MWLFKSRTPKYSGIHTGIDRQQKCNGCSRVEVLIEQTLKTNKPPSGRLPFHSDFKELDECAKKCATCRIFRQALLLKCTTSSEASELSETTSGCPIYASVKLPAPSASNETARFVLKVDIRGHTNASVLVQCDASDNSPANGLNLQRNPHADAIAEHAKRWLTECVSHHHSSCSDLRWSTHNPSRLVRITSKSKLQLCDGAQMDGGVEYAALSYSWGTQVVSTEELQIIDGSKTTRKNLASRYESFSLEKLPNTLADAISFCQRVGLSYMWIDSLCIVQDDHDRADFMQEAPRMHEYYGNATFTLAVCSNVKATDAFLRPRTAFNYHIKPCRLGSLWLLMPDISLTDLAPRSPLSTRAWTLQEERLSRRILYWTPNRMYWSCAQVQHGESQLQTSEEPGRISAKESLSPTCNSHQPATAFMPQAFLLACNRGAMQQRHKAWLSIVESYVSRNMSNPQDRFPAVAGLAAKYHQASSSVTDNTYIAGLWKGTFAVDLAWSVKRAAAEPLASSMSTMTPPSWAWASLPTCTEIQHSSNSTDATYLDLVQIDRGKDVSCQKARSSTDIVQRGSLITHVRVRARLRPFWRMGSIYRPWAQVIQNIESERETGSATASQQILFSFSLTPEESAFSLDLVSGKVVSYEARKKEVIGQLDYKIHAEFIAECSVSIFAIELTDTAMLLLQKVGDGQTYRRVGLATSHRPDFFSDMDKEEVKLI